MSGEEGTSMDGKREERRGREGSKRTTGIPRNQGLQHNLPHLSPPLEVGRELKHGQVRQVSLALEKREREEACRCNIPTRDPRTVRHPRWRR